MPISLLAVFGKNDKIDLSHKEKLALKKVVAAIIKRFKGEEHGQSI